MESNSFPNLQRAIERVLDEAYVLNEQLENQYNASGEDSLRDPQAYATVSEISHNTAAELLERLENRTDAGTRAFAGSVIRGHQYHQKFLMQSAFIERALCKPQGYAGDKDLMLMICENVSLGKTPYAKLKNQVYLDLPAAEAVRQRIRSLRQRLDSLPDGAVVLNLACGPAMEVRSYLEANPRKAIQIDLLDHDILTTRYTRQTINDPRVRHLIGNAFQIIKGNYRVATPRTGMWHRCSPKDDFRSRARWRIPVKYIFSDLKSRQYDLIYSAGLYDYIEDFPSDANRGVRALTRRLFDLLKPGGTLIVGNFLTPGAKNNPHVHSHRLMMELYSDWNLLYRTPAQIANFVSAIPLNQFDLIETSEFFDQPSVGAGAIGFLHVTRKTAE